jgi:hypothetical protein
MGRITITKDNAPTSEQFKEMLELMEARDSPLESLFRLMRELVAYEEKYDMPSDVFYARLMQGELDDELPYIKWAGRYELYLEAREELENLLAKAVVMA